MTQPLDLNELARESIDAMPDGFGQWELEEIEKALLSALTKLAADKDAEKQRFVNRLAKALDDLAGHKAALKIATDALEQIDVPKREVASITACRALQQIKELKP